MASEIDLKAILSKLQFHDKNQAKRVNECIEALKNTQKTMPKQDSAFFVLCLIYSLIKQNSELLNPPNLEKLNNFCVETIKREIPYLLTGMSQPDISILLEADFKNSTEMLILIHFMLETLKNGKFKNNNKLHSIFHIAHEAIMHNHTLKQPAKNKTLDAKQPRC